MKHKAGFVSIVGNPNAGKSTLMNALVGEKLSIITSKAQTTRHRIMGIVNGEDFQIVYADTPGFLDPAYKLQEKMMGAVHSSLTDADILLFVVDLIDEKLPTQELIDEIIKTGVPVLVLLNKVDLGDQNKLEMAVQSWSQKLPKAEILPVSALRNFNLSLVFDKIISLLPESPPYYDKEELTDRSQRFFVSEIIREKILMIYDKEIPYASEVIIESFKEKVTLTSIRATILVERDSQKGIVIGHQGAMLKKLGTMARKEMETFLERKVFLELFVKVDKDWRSNEGRLRQFGYQ